MKQGTQSDNSGASYLDTENGTVQNLGSWLLDPLDEETLAVLCRVERGTQGFRRGRSNVAYLVSRDCITADCNAETLAITPTGRDALAYFGGENRARR